MSSKVKEDALNFLIDEFFIYHGLDDLEKHSTNQDNTLESLMQKSYELLNEIYKIKTNIKITKKINHIKNCSAINKYTFAYEHSKKKKINSSKSNDLKNIDINRKSFGIQNCIRQIDINSLCFKKKENINLKKDKSSVFTNVQKIKIKNFKKQNSQNIEHKNKIMSNVNNYMSDKNIKKTERKRNKKIAARHFAVSLLD